MYKCFSIKLTTGLEITAGPRTMSRQNWNLSGQIYAMLVTSSSNVDPQTWYDQAKTNLGGHHDRRQTGSYFKPYNNIMQRKSNLASKSRGSWLGRQYFSDNKGKRTICHLRFENRTAINDPFFF